METHDPKDKPDSDNGGGDTLPSYDYQPDDSVIEYIEKGEPQGDTETR